MHETSSEMQKQSGDKDLRTIQIHYLGREGKPHPIYMNNSSCSFLSQVHFWYGPKIPRPTLCIEFITVMDQFSYLSKGQGFTKDTLEDVTDADDLWLQTREMKKPSKNPRTNEETPVTTAIVIACKRMFKIFSLI